MAIYYPGLRGGEFDNIRGRVVERLTSLRQGLRRIPQKQLDQNLLVATWNLRDFGGRRLNPEPRLPESYYYIAEIIDRFDIVALQEVNEDMRAFEKLRRILGNQYNFIATDVTEGRGGNGERMVFVYDKRKVSFLNIAGEVVLPPLRDAEGDPRAILTQFARTPFVVSFQCGWLKFDLCTAHLYYGDSSGPGKERRVAEVRALGAFMAARAERHQSNVFILGDFNVVGPNDPTWKALEESRFVMPPGIRDFRTNMALDKYYDRIAFLSPRNQVSFVAEGGGGSFDYRDHVFRDTEEDEAHYRGIGRAFQPGSEYAGSYKDWKTWQMSDHLPLWVQIETDFADKYLRSL